MATMLESGQIMLRQPQGGVPMVQPQLQATEPVAARAAAQQAGTLAQILDRMSESAFKEAGRLAEQEALQFNADNPITPEQIELAKNGVQLTPGLSESIYNQALRKARGLQLSGHFEIEGRNELAKMLVDIQQGKATGEQISQKISNIANGYGKILANENPEAAIKFRATIATYGNTVLNAAYEAEMKREKAQRIAKFDMDFDNGVRLLEATVTQQPERIDELADVFRRNVTMQAMLLGDAALQKEYSTKFETSLRNAKINALTQHLLSNEYIANPEETLTRIRDGNIGKMSPVLRQLVANDFDAVAKITANYMVSVNQRETLAANERNRLKREGERDATNLLELIFSKTPDDPQLPELKRKLMELPEGSVPLGILKDVLNPNQPESNKRVLFNVTQGIFNNTITNPEQIWQMIGKGLSAPDAVASLKLLNSEDRRDQSELDRGISRLAGIPVIPGSVVVLDPKGEEFKRRSELQAQALDIQSQAARDGKVFTPRQILQQLETNLESRRNSEAAKQANKQLKDRWEKLDWINGPITRDTLPTLRAKAGTDRGRLQDVSRIEKLLNQAEGITP